MMLCGRPRDGAISRPVGPLRSRPAAQKTLRPSAAPIPRQGKERPVTDQSATMSSPFPIQPKPTAAAARTKLLLEGRVLPTLLRLAAPNVLNLLAFAGVI